MAFIYPQFLIFKENKSITVTRINYVYSIYRYLSTDYYYMLCVFHGFRAHSVDGLIR